MRRERGRSGRTGHRERRTGLAGRAGGRRSLGRRGRSVCGPVGRRESGGDCGGGWPVARGASSERKRARRGPGSGRRPQESGAAATAAEAGGREGSGPTPTAPRVRGTRRQRRGTEGRTERERERATRAPGPAGARTGDGFGEATWLILPVVICLSQRLSHACASMSGSYCETANGSLNQLSST